VDFSYEGIPKFALVSLIVFLAFGFPYFLITKILRIKWNWEGFLSLVSPFFVHALLFMFKINDPRFGNFFEFYYLLIVLAVALFLNLYFVYNYPKKGFEKYLAVVIIIAFVFVRLYSTSLHDFPRSNTNISN